MDSDCCCLSAAAASAAAAATAAAGEEEQEEEDADDDDVADERFSAPVEDRHLLGGTGPAVKSTTTFPSAAVPTLPQPKSAAPGHAGQVRPELWSWSCLVSVRERRSFPAKSASLSSPCKAAVSAALRSAAGRGGSNVSPLLPPPPLPPWLLLLLRRQDVGADLTHPLPRVVEAS